MKYAWKTKKSLNSTVVFFTNFCIYTCEGKQWRWVNNVNKLHLDNFLHACFLYSKKTMRKKKYWMYISLTCGVSFRMVIGSYIYIYCRRCYKCVKRKKMLMCGNVLMSSIDLLNVQLVVEIEYFWMWFPPPPFQIFCMML